MASETDSPLEEADPNSVTALFDRDPSVLPNAPLDQIIAELRRRADVEAARIAAEAAAPKTPKGRKKKGDDLVDMAAAALADKPIEEVNLDDLLPNGSIEG